MFKKKDSLLIHCVKRAKERYSITVDNKIIKAMCKQIQKRDRCRCVYKVSNSKTIWDIEYNNVMYRVIYNKKYKYLTTFLELDMLPTNSDFIKK